MPTVATTNRAHLALADLAARLAPWLELAPEVVTVLRHALGFDAFCLCQNDPISAMPAVGVADNDVIGRQQQRFWQIEIQRADVNKTRTMVEAGTPVAVLSAATGGDLACSARWDELLGPGGLGDELRAALVLDGLWWGSLALYRERRARPFTAEDVHAVAQLLHPMAVAARNAWTPRSRSRGSSPGPGTIVVSAEGSELSATHSARQVLDLLDPGQRDGCALIHAMVARLTAVSGPYGPADSVRSLIRGTEGSWIQFDASRLRSRLGDGTIAITVQPAPPVAVTDLLMHACALTSRERQIAELTISGRSTTEIANDLFVSRHTVVDHLKSIFAKTGVHSRQELRGRLAGAPEVANDGPWARRRG